MNVADVLDGTRIVEVAVPDNVGRLMGKRLPVEVFRDLVPRGVPMPDYFLVTWLDNEPQDGFAVTGWHTGWRNATLRPDLTTLRRVPWDPEAAIVLCDTFLADAEPAPMASRQLLARQLKRAADHGVTAVCASELEFWRFAHSYRDVHSRCYRDLLPSHHRLQDNDLLQAAADEPFVSQLRDRLGQLGIPVVVYQGEGGDGQHEINLAHAPMLEMADRTVLYKHAAKDLAYRHEQAITFMAKWDGARASSSGHVHLSLTDPEGRPLLWDENRQDLSDLGRSFLGGLIDHTAELMVLHAPFTNSYKRLTPGSFAPVNLSWGYDNRTVCFRVVGKGESFRIECRMPGADANPYWSYAALLAAGLAGLEQGSVPPEPTDGNAYEDDSIARLPADLAEALRLFAASSVARDSLGSATHEHIRGLIARELEHSRRAVSEWELRRGFEVA